MAKKKTEVMLEFFSNLAKKIEKVIEEDKARARERTAAREDEPRIQSINEVHENELPTVEQVYEITEQAAVVREYQQRHLEWTMGTFFWKAIIYSGGAYKPQFNKGLFDPPLAAGEKSNNVYDNKSKNS